MNTLSDLLLSKTPKYKLTIPSSQKEVKYRPFLVKEEKILLIAQETGTHRDMLEAIENVIESCVDDISDASSLPIFDIEYIFLRLRAKSVSETASPIIVCPETDEEISLEINLMEIEPTVDEKHKRTVEIDNDIKVTLNYPTLKMIKNKEDNIDYDDPESFYDIIINCIAKIETPDETINVSTLPKSEIKDFIENMNKNQFEKILDFFITSPRLQYQAKYTTSDGVEREVTLHGISDFLE